MAGGYSKLLPTQLRAAAKRSNRLSLDDSIHELERLLSCYDLPFPFFTKIDSSRFDHEEEDEEYWLLERIGWEPRQPPGRRLIYVGEVIGLSPAEEQNQIVSINSLSAPWLEGARPLDHNLEFLREDIQFEALIDLPESLKEKISGHWAEFLRSFSVLIERMQEYEAEFEDFVEERVSQYLEHYGISRQRIRHETLEDIFHRQRRVELFYEFLESQAQSLGK